MKITASAVYDLKTVKSFSRMLFTKKANPKKLFIMLGVLDFTFLIFSVMGMLVFGFSQLMLDIIFMSALLAFLFYFMYFISPKISYKSIAKLKNVKNNYIFTDDEMSVTTNSDDFQGSSVLKYSVLCRAKETNKYLYIYQTKAQAFIVDKSTIAGGTIEELRARLTSVLGKKYIICNY